MSNFKNKLWVEKYRPQTVADYVFVDTRQQQQVESWVKDQSCPHVLFAGAPGTGKTTIINALSYALYGQALSNIRKDNLVNKTNGKNMLVSLDFVVNGQEYKIERGRKPNILKF